MKFLQSLARALRGKDLEAAQAVDDANTIPNAKLAISDSKTAVDRFTRQIADLIAANNLLKRQRTDSQAEVDKWQGIAVKAAKAQDEAGAREALTRKADFTKVLATQNQEIERNDVQIAKLREQLEAARAKIAKAEGSLTRLTARTEGAKIRTGLAQASTMFNSGSNPLAALDDLEKAADREEATAEAYEEMAGDAATAAGADLEAKYASSSADVEAELAALMGTKPPTTDTAAPPTS